MIKGFSLPITSIETNEAFMRHLRTKLDMQGGLVAGVADIASPVLSFMVDVFFGTRSPSDFEVVGKVFAGILQDTMVVIDEAKRATKPDANFTIDMTLPMGQVLKALDTENDKSHFGRNRSSALAIAAKAAYR